MFEHASSHDSSPVKPIRIGLLGCGVVGTQVARLITEQAADLAHRVGAPVELAGIAVRRLDQKREVDLPEDLFTDDAESLVRRGDIDVVVEVIGGIEPAKSLIIAALETGSSVISANKALLAEAGAELFEVAERHDRDLYYEAAVAGAIPILRPLRESLAGDSVTKVMGIVNGTTNYILDKMDSTGAGFAEALAEAQQLGYAEADPTADIEGFDAASKAAILASLAFHTRVTSADVYREGITKVTVSDIASAREMGCVIKLMAICSIEQTVDGEAVSARVHPAMIPRSHPLASVRGAYNAVFVESEAAGQLMFYGPGAGGSPTASAVMGDLVSAARNRLGNTRGPAESAYADLGVLPIGQSQTRYHLQIDVEDKAGVLAEIARVFAEHEVSIQIVRQAAGGEDAHLVVVSHQATDADLSETVASIKAMPHVREVSSVMRVEGEFD